MADNKEETERKIINFEGETEAGQKISGNLQIGTSENDCYMKINITIEDEQE